MYLVFEDNVFENNAKTGVKQKAHANNDNHDDDDDVHEGDNYSD